MHSRTVFFVSDGTGITAETFGNAILAQFEMKPRHVRLPFIDTVDKAHQAVRQINHTAEVEGRKPIVFTTLVNMEVLKVIQDGCKGMLLDMFGTFVHPLEQELGIKSHHRVGRFSDVSRSKEYTDRIEAINFSLAHDDGQSNRDLAGADVILVGVSRSGKTPTSLYLAMQCGLKAANYPLIPEDFERRQLPPALVPGQADAEGAAVSRAARDFWQHDWQGRSLMAVGAQDPVLGMPAMQALQRDIRGCPPPIVLPQAGHFVPEHGQALAVQAVEYFRP